MQTQTSRLAWLWARLRHVLVDEKPRDLLGRSVLATLLFIAAVLGREALHAMLPGSVRYLTFFPSLTAAGFLCGVVPSVILLAAFAITGFLWTGADNELVTVRLILALVFVVAGAAVIFPASYAVHVRSQLKMHGQRLVLLNDELRHRIKNLFAVVCSICTQTISTGFHPEEMSRDIIGRIQAIASAQDFLSITQNTGSELRELVQAVVAPLCPGSGRTQILGPSVLLPAHLTTAFALVLHELATNALKYGAWPSNSEGIVMIEWGVNADQLRFASTASSCRLRRHGGLAAS